MSEVLVVVDSTVDGVSKPTLELLSIARGIGSPSAVVFGDNLDTAKDRLTAHGAEKIYHAAGDVFENYLVAPKAEVLASIVTEVNPAAVLVVSSAAGKEIAARLAVKCESGIITDATSVEAADGGITATQSAFAGGYTLTGRVTTGTPIITVRPNSAPVSDQAGAGEVVSVEVSVSEAAQRAKITSRTPREKSGRPELTEAAIVVSGGRGTNGDFAPVESFADALGAAVGASRAAVDAGWYPHSNQVGQTGKQVSPTLYVANGISGAIQHRAGMQTSKMIVAVNKDEEAPIFEMVDFGVVGDLFNVLPQATEKINANK